MPDTANPASPAVGDEARDFTLPAAGGGEVTLSALRPAAVVVYFYPMDDTPGCTKEAEGFTEHDDAFRAAGVTVLGVSKDSVAQHERFAAKRSLTIALLSDEHGQVCEDWGVWGEKSMYGKTYMGIERATFLIDGQGRIREVWRKVKVPGHVEAVLAAAQAL